MNLKVRISGDVKLIFLPVRRLCYTIPVMPVSPEKMQKLQEMMQRLGVHRNDLEEKFVRGSGKGGQKVNKCSNCVYLTHVPSGIVVRCHCERTSFLFLCG